MVSPDSIECYPRHLIQAIMNLVANAIGALAVATSVRKITIEKGCRSAIRPCETTLVRFRSKMSLAEVPRLAS